MKPDSDAAAAPASARRDAFLGAWAWLFPASYLLHVAEEYWAPPGFSAWVSRSGRVGLSELAFLLTNALFFALMAIVVFLAVRRLWSAWLLLVLATIVTVNGFLHLGGTLLAGSYSPGLVSGVFLWTPLGVVTLVRGARALGARDLGLGVAVGLLVHLLVPLVGLALTGLLGPNA